MAGSVGSISANITEGYGRTSGPDRAKFYEYAYSSAREARDWYYKVRHALEHDVAINRIALVTRVMRILTVAIVRERAEPKTRARRVQDDADLRRSDPVDRTPSGSQQPARAASCQLGLRSS